jgi:RPA family protein
VWSGFKASKNQAATTAAATATVMEKQQRRGDSDAMKLQIIDPIGVLKFALSEFIHWDGPYQ